MEKIKCVISENGTIIPIHNIAVISAKNASHYIWTNGDIEHTGYKLSNGQYNALLRELEFICDKYNIRGIKSKHAEGKLGEMIKEMKSANKIEPKFNVDDIISNGISEVKIVSIESNYYNVTNYEIENDAHICNWVVYFKDQDNWKLKDRVQPQSNKGEQKVADKKESLTDVEKSILNFADYFHSNRCKPESEWVDEIKMLRDYIPSRILKLATWSKEDEKIYQSIIDDTVQENQLDIKQIDWLKSIKDRVQPKIEWSEEDERLFQIVIDVLDRANHLGNISRTDLIACVRKLKSLRPQKQWKPSDQQIATIGYIIKGYESTTIYLYDEAAKQLYLLLEQLKQLYYGNKRIDVW